MEAVLSDQIKLLFTAEPFGFGPISSTISIVKQIKKIEPRKICIFIGRGTSYQLASKSNIFDQVYHVENFSKLHLNLYNSNIITSNCIMISNTYPAGSLLAKELNIKCFFIDTLFWMWDRLPVKFDDVEKYYVENFHCTDLRLDRFGISNKIQVIPPLIDLEAKPKNQSSPLLIITLGGIDSDFTNFPLLYEKLIEYLSNHNMQKYEILICGGGKKLHEAEIKKYENKQLKITCLSPEEHISYLKAASLVIASPGVHGFYENYLLDKNTLFLPPQNYSQHLQLSYIMKTFHDVIGIRFSDLAIINNLAENLPEEEGIREIANMNKILLDNQKSLEIFFATIEKFLNGDLITNWKCDNYHLDKNRFGASIVANDLLSFISNNSLQKEFIYE